MRAHARLLAGFLLLFVVYQASEGLQTVIAPGNPLGPALMLAALLLAWPVGRWIDGSGYRAFGLHGPQGARLLLAMLLLALLAKLAGEALALGLGLERFTPMLALTAPAVALAVVSTFVPSLAEDILTRGVLLRLTPRPLGPWGYVLGSALLYTLNHVWRFDWGLSEQLRLFCLGLAYAAAAWRFGSLWAAVGLHWGWNLGNALLSQAWPGAVLEVTGNRLLSAAIHLALLAIVLAWPRPSVSPPIR
ncbi:CPBP family intramembrane glutamic endopeptidase [Thermomonas alba]|uniref:CPBP family intramembrane glutamic endopeptidase n=1 Tax=Thermomonas alba TaxID=2888525 RepID=UPI001F048B8F|nr:CPBP family intramembrane glutamic endopeptidase [Thermomonas alba]